MLRLRKPGGMVIFLKAQERMRTGAGTFPKQIKLPLPPPSPSPTVELQQMIGFEVLVPLFLKKPDCNFFFFFFLDQRISEMTPNPAGSRKQEWDT